MGLTEYQRKRHFDRTAEPAGKVARKAGWSYVVQKHDASQLHYDFRLELDGVLKSWAVPKGPSLDPGVKRLAMHVEDHPVQYGDFEGIIPPGEYGGGTVMLWDRGYWEPIGDPHEGYRRGRLKFILHGKKLRGRWMLIRAGGGSSPGDQRRWLLFKDRDDEARAAKQGDVLLDEPLSVSTGRDLAGIAGDADRIWGKSPGTKKSAKRPPRTAPVKRRTRPPGPLPGKKVRRLPTRIEVQLATLATDAPAGDEWVHEIKFDGYRMICRIDHGRAKFISRNHQDWTRRLPSLTDQAARLRAKQALLDGEVVSLRTDGTTDFQELQNAFRDGRQESLHYFVFDLLHLDGYDLTGLPLSERKELLAGLLASSATPAQIHLSEHVEGQGPDFLRQACKKGLEGIVSKRRAGSYQPGRGYDWIKTKCVKNEEFVIGGYTEPAGSRSGFGALLLGYHDAQDRLLYAGKVGTGFDERALHSLRARLTRLNRAESPFADFKRGGTGTHWVRPTLVAQIAYGARTRDGLLRHASFQGLREDKPAEEVMKDKAVSLATAQQTGRGNNRSQRKLPGASKNGQLVSSGGSIEFAGVRLTSPAKVLYPDVGITKLNLAEYYELVADRILPHIEGRPLVLVRCPEGRRKDCFYQKHPGAGTPEELRRIPIREKNKTQDYAIVDDIRGLIALTQVGVLEIHAWGSREDKLEYPDRLIFDLDPDAEVPWNRVVQSARQVRDFLKELGLESFVKTTGGKGLHVVVPIERRHEWDEAKQFCKQVAHLIVAADPDRYTANMSKAARPGKIFVDYLRNGRGSTAVVPYSTRAKPGAPVSVPLTWQELSPRLGPAHFNIQNIRHRLAARKTDPWEGLAEVRQSLATPMKKIASLNVT